MNSSREINDNVNSIEWFDTMGPDNSHEAAKEQASNDATNLYSDNIVAVCEAMNSEVPQHRVMTDEERHERRLESNRLSARRRRQRHASQVHDLQEQVRSLSSENLELRAEHDRLQALMRQHEGVVQWDNRCDDAVNWELRDSDEKEDDQQPQQPPLVYGEQIPATLMHQPTVALSNVPLERRRGDAVNQAFVDSRYQSLQDNWSLEHRVGNNESASTINQESVFDSFAAFSNVAEQRHFMVNNPLDSVGHDNVNQERHTLLESRNTNSHDSQRNNANYAVAIGDEPESSAGSISMPGDVSEYFDMLFHSQEPATMAWHQVHNRENPLAPDPNFHSIDTLTPPNVPLVQDWHPNSAGDDSLSSCPLAFANEVSNEQNVGDLGPLTEDIFDSK